MTDLSVYEHIRSGGSGFYEQKRGLISVWGKEAVQFLDGMITNDMKTLVDGQQMLAAFPNAQGRLLAVVRVQRQGDRFLFETEEATREKVYQNLFRFTFAGDFFVEDLSDGNKYFEIFGQYNVNNVGEADGSKSSPPYEGGVAAFRGRGGSLMAAIGEDDAEGFRKKLVADGAVEIDDPTYEILRIENGVPKYGVDMDETTIVPELGLEDMISYTKGCYIGQEIIARIHFRGHVAKQIRGLVISTQAPIEVGSTLTAPDLKPAGRITSISYSPKIEMNVALGYVRYDYLDEFRILIVGDKDAAMVRNLPIVV